MPLYEYICEAHGRFEVFVKHWSEKKPIDFCPKKVYQNNTTVICNRVSEYAPSAPSMQPDSYWHTGLYDERCNKMFKNRQHQEEYFKAEGIETTNKYDGLPGDTAEQRAEKIYSDPKLTKAREDAFGECYAEWKNGAAFEDYKVPPAFDE